MTSKPALRIGFAGTPEFAAQQLDALLERSLQVVAVYTQPDRPLGRGKKVQASPVKVLAQSRGIPVLQPETLKNASVQDEMRALKLDVLVVVAYGLILPKEILAIPRYGCINVHASLLPRWRGAAPIERAILAGDAESGVCIMQMDEGLDTGDILAMRKTPIRPEDNSASLTKRLSSLGQELLPEVLDSIQDDSLSPIKQDDSLSTYASKIEKQEALIDWQDSAIQIQRKVNAFYPRSPAYCFYRNQRLRITQASVINETPEADAGTIIQVSVEGIKVSCGSSCLLIRKIQLPGKAETEIKNFLNGRKDYFSVGDRFERDQE